jgi:hypothetical protein
MDTKREVLTYINPADHASTMMNLSSACGGGPSLAPRVGGPRLAQSLPAQRPVSPFRILENTMTRSAFAVLSFLGLLLLSQTAASGADECTGYMTNVLISATTTDMGGGHVMTVSRYTNIVITDDPADIRNMLMGECSGTTLTMPDGKSRTVGYCLRKDKNGDTSSFLWGWELGADKGYWQSIGGTGKFANIDISGWWRPAASDGGPRSVARYGGKCLQ